MSKFTLSISCFTTCNVPDSWIRTLIHAIYLTLQVPMQYCSLQHQTLLSPPETSTTGCCFPLLLSLFIPSGAISLPFSSSILGTYWPGEFIVQCPIFFCLFILSLVSSKQESWSVLPFPSPVDHILSELSSRTCPSWVALHDVAHSFLELDKAVSMWLVWVVFWDCGFHCVCPLMDRDKRLM